MNSDRTVVLWCNALEHITLTVLHRGWDGGEALQRWLCVMRALEARVVSLGLSFCVDRGLGFLVTAVERLGLACTAQCRVRLPTRSKEVTPLLAVCEKAALRIARLGGREGEEAGGREGEEEVWGVETRRMYGVSEVALVGSLLQGVVLLLHVAKELKGLPSR
jgi:protein-arginine kinase